MEVQISNTPLKGSITIIPSKSYAHRAFICAAFSEKETIIDNIPVPLSEDFAATLGCLESLGAKVTQQGSRVIISPVQAGKKDKYFLDCGESGATLRFILPLLSAAGFTAQVKGHGRLPKRPIEPLVKALREGGGQVSHAFPLELEGRISKYDFSIEGNISSQFISGLLMAIPLTGQGGSVKILGKIESAPYIDMTLKVMEDFGITVTRQGNVFSIKAGQKYISPSRYIIEGDWSNAAFWLVAGAFSQEGVEVKGLNPHSLQGDKEIVEILKKFGAKVDSLEDSVTVKKSPMKGIEIDAADITDLVPVISALACAAQGKTTIYNAQRLRLKESDRLETVCNSLKAIGADIEITADGLNIYGGKKLKGGKSSSYNDHRIAMTLAVAAPLCEKDVIIEQAQSVNKSYPKFYNILKGE